MPPEQKKPYRIRIVSRKYGTVAWYCKRGMHFTFDPLKAEIYGGRWSAKEMATKLDKSWVGELHDVVVEIARSKTTKGGMVK